jgi:cation diffusion facilitator family transporter
MAGNNRLHEALRVTRIGIFANVGLIIIKFTGGIIGKSGAVIADAVHSFADFATDIIVIVGLKLSDKPADNTHRYGHGKFETLSSLILGIILLATGIGICWSGIGNIILFVEKKIHIPTDLDCIRSRIALCDHKRMALHHYHSKRKKIEQPIPDCQRH